MNERHPLASVNAFAELFSKSDLPPAGDCFAGEAREHGRDSTRVKRALKRTVIARVQYSAKPHRTMYVTFDRAKVTKARSGAGKEDSPAPDTSTLFAVSYGQSDIQSRVGAFAEISSPAILRSPHAQRAAHRW